MSAYKVNTRDFVHKTSDPWRWAPAAGEDIQDIIDMLLVDYGAEGAGLLEIDPVECSRRIMLAVVNQMYNPTTEFVSVARLTNEQKSLVAFTWCIRDQRATWSREEQCQPVFLSVDLRIPSRARAKLCVQAMQLWERWSEICGIKVITSNNMRRDWEPLMRLHSRMGYEVRGSMAWKRLNTVNLAVPEIYIPETQPIIITGSGL